MAHRLPHVGASGVRVDRTSLPAARRPVARPSGGAVRLAVLAGGEPLAHPRGRPICAARGSHRRQSDGAQSGVHLSNDVDRRTAEMGQGAMHGVLHRRRGLRAHHLRWLGTGRRRVPVRRQRLPVRLGVAIQSGRAERPSASVAAHPADRQLRGAGAQHLPSSRGDDPAWPAQGAHAREGHLHPHIAAGARRRGRRLGLGSHRRGHRLREIPSGQSDHGRRTGRGRPVHEVERHDSGRHHAASRSRRHGRPHACVDERVGSGRGQLRAAGVRERRGRRVRVLPEPRSGEIIASPRRPAVGLQSEIRTLEDARIRVSRLPVGRP